MALEPYLHLQPRWPASSWKSAWEFQAKQTHSYSKKAFKRFDWFSMCWLMKSSPDGPTGFRKPRPQSTPLFFLPFMKLSGIISELSTLSPAVELKLIDCTKDQLRAATESLSCQTQNQPTPSNWNHFKSQLTEVMRLRGSYRADASLDHKPCTGILTPLINNSVLLVVLCPLFSACQQLVPRQKTPQAKGGAFSWLSGRLEPCKKTSWLRSKYLFPSVLIPFGVFVVTHSTWRPLQLAQEGLLHLRSMEETSTKASAVSLTSRLVPGEPDHTCIPAGTCTLRAQDKVIPAEDKTTEVPVRADGDSSPTRLIHNAPDDLKEQMETLGRYAWRQRTHTDDGLQQNSPTVGGRLIWARREQPEGPSAETKHLDLFKYHYNKCNFFPPSLSLRNIFVFCSNGL